VFLSFILFSFGSYRSDRSVPAFPTSECFVSGM
jgi:hypothetical protein